MILTILLLCHQFVARTFIPYYWLRYETHEATSQLQSILADIRRASEEEDISDTVPNIKF